MSLTFKQATMEDVDTILHYIHEIAVYEKLEDTMETTRDNIIDWMFTRNVTHCLILQVDNQPIGFALYFFNYSTFTGRGGLYLEDFYIDEPYRHHGYGKQTLVQLAKIAKENNCARMEWVCLNWNTSSIQFYKNLGAVSLDEWSTYRLTEDKIDLLANQ